MGNGEVPNDPRDPSRWIFRRYRAAFANCVAGIQAAGHPKEPRGSKIQRWKDKPPGGYTNRVCPITDPILLEETT